MVPATTTFIFLVTSNKVGEDVADDTDERLRKTMEDSARQMDDKALRLERARLLKKSEDNWTEVDDIGLDTINRELEQRNKPPLGPV